MLPAVTQTSPLLLLLPLLALCHTEAQVPGLVYTANGYDTLMGKDAICWTAPAYYDEEHMMAMDGGHEYEEVMLRQEDFNGRIWHQDLVPGFMAGPTTMMASCPTGTSLDLELIRETQHGSDKLRTKRFYTFRFSLSLDLRELRRAMDLDQDAWFYSNKTMDDKDGLLYPLISIQLQFCPNNGNLCSPFSFDSAGLWDEMEMMKGMVHTEGNDQGHGEHEGGDNGLHAHSKDEIMLTMNEGIRHGEHDEHSGHSHGQLLRRRRRLSTTTEQLTEQQNDIETGNATGEVKPHWHNASISEDANDLHDDHDLEHQEEQGRDQDHEEIEAEDHEDLDHNNDETELASHNGQDLHDEHDQKESQPEYHDGHDLSNVEAEEEPHGHHDHEESREDLHDGHDHGNDDEEEHNHGDFAKGAAASPRFYLEVPKDSAQDVFTVKYDLDIEIEQPGDYLPLATVEFFFTNATVHGHVPMRDEMAVFKVNLANLLHERSITYHPPVQINEVTSGVALTSYVVVGACAVAQLVFLGLTFHHRDESVMRLSQASFLILLQAASLMAIMGSVFYRPTSSWSCYIAGPLTLVPLQLMFAIIFGRLRRIILIMQPLMSFNRAQTKSSIRTGMKKWKAIMMLRSSSSNKRSSHKSSSNISSTASPHDAVEANDEGSSTLAPLKRLQKNIAPAAAKLRVEFSAERLWTMIAIVTLPMVVVEACALALFPPDLVLVLNEEESIGRYQCGDSQARTFHLASTSILFLTMVADLCQVQTSKSLPAFFNEANEISNGLLLGIFVTAMGFAVIIISDDPTGNPNVTYLMEVLVLLFVSLNVSLRLTLPKLKLIWKGEKVVVSKILQEHREKKERKLTPQISGLTLSSFNTSFVNPSGSFNGSTNQVSRKDVCDVMGDGSTDTFACDENRRPNRDGSSPLFPINEVVPFQPEEQARPTTHSRLVVVDGRAPPSRLTMQLVSLSRDAARVNDKVLSGLAVERKDWIGLRASAEEFQSLMQNAEFRDEERKQ